MRWQDYRRFLIRLLPPILLVVVLLFFFGYWTNGAVMIERPLSSIGAWFNRLWVKQFPSGSESVFCAAEASDLLMALAVDRSFYESVLNENENLRQQLNFFERQSFNYLPAEIITRSAIPTDTIFIIDRGVDDGVSVGAAVIMADGHLVGKIIETRKKTAIVRSLLSRESEVAVSLLNTSRTIGLGQGSGGALLSLKFIPQDEIITVNDLVVTSGLEAAIPPGLIVGVITGVERDEAAPFQTATVEPLIDSRRFNSVSVIILSEGL
jgi:rod shape-determining protein MreC